MKQTQRRAVYAHSGGKIEGNLWEPHSCDGVHCSRCCVHCICEKVREGRASRREDHQLVRSSRKVFRQCSAEVDICKQNVQCGLAPFPTQQLQQFLASSGYTLSSEDSKIYCKRTPLRSYLPFIDTYADIIRSWFGAPDDLVLVRCRVQLGLPGLQKVCIYEIRLTGGGPSLQ